MIQVTLQPGHGRGQISKIKEKTKQHYHNRRAPSYIAIIAQCSHYVDNSAVKLIATDLRHLVDIVNTHTIIETIPSYFSCHHLHVVHNTTTHFYLPIYLSISTSIHVHPPSPPLLYISSLSTSHSPRQSLSTLLYHIRIDNSHPHNLYYIPISKN